MRRGAIEANHRFGHPVCGVSDLQAARRGPNPAFEDGPEAFDRIRVCQHELVPTPGVALEGTYYCSDVFRGRVRHPQGLNSILKLTCVFRIWR